MPVALKIPNWIWHVSCFSTAHEQSRCLGQPNSKGVETVALPWDNAWDHKCIVAIDGAVFCCDSSLLLWQNQHPLTMSYAIKNRTSGCECLIALLVLSSGCLEFARGLPKHLTLLLCMHLVCPCCMHSGSCQVCLETFSPILKIACVSCLDGVLLLNVVRYCFILFWFLLCFWCSIVTDDKQDLLQLE